MRVARGGKVQLRVSGIQVLAADRPVGQPRDLHLAQHGVQIALVATLDTTPRRALSADHPTDARLEHSAQIELVPQHLAGQPATVLGQPRLEPRMLKP